MTIPTITEMRFPKSDDGKRTAYSYLVDFKNAYPEANTELIEGTDNIVLLITYNIEYEGRR